MRDRNSLSRVVPAPVQGVDEAARAAAPLNDALRALHAAGREAWPDVPLDAEAFAADVTNRVDAHRNLDDAVSTLHAADLFLACACSRGIASALAAFDRVQLARVPEFVRRIDSSAAFGDEVAQTIREEFLVRRRGAEPRIAGYSGRGALSSWVRIIAVRTALRLRRERGRAGEVASHEPGLDRAGAVDPELDYLKLRYQGAYQEALETALASLPDRDALLLKLHYLDRLSIDRIGAIYGIDRSTVARWRATVRRKILASTQELLRSRFSLTSSEFDSLSRLVRSQLVLSLRSALRTSRVADQ